MLWAEVGGRCGVWQSDLRRAGEEIKQPKLAFRLILKEWRLPTLAESIKPLPSATLRLTAVFGMGTGRTTAS